LYLPVHETTVNRRNSRVLLRRGGADGRISLPSPPAGNFSREFYPADNGVSTPLVTRVIRDETLRGEENREFYKYFLPFPHPTQQLYEQQLRENIIKIAIISTLTCCSEQYNRPTMCAFGKKRRRWYRIR